MDTGTVRLVIFLGMFLVFAGDYSLLISSIFGNATDRNITMRRSEIQLRGPQDKLPIVSDRDKDSAALRRAKMMTTIKTACLPKLICELIRSSVYKNQLNSMEQSLFNLIRDTSLSTKAETLSAYHFAAHMGQLISGIEGQGCHNFYPTCPLPSASVLNMMKKIRLP